MTSLIRDAVVIAVAATFAFVGGSIVWHKIVAIPPSFEVAEPEDDLDPPEAQGPDDDAWDRDHDRWTDREAGIW